MPGRITVLSTGFAAYIEIRDASNVLITTSTHPSREEANDHARFPSQQRCYAGYKLELLRPDNLVPRF